MQAIQRFSPVAGIKVVERMDETSSAVAKALVSVPLPGLRSWKAYSLYLDDNEETGFSPVAGIKVVERWEDLSIRTLFFSRFQSRCRD